MILGKEAIIITREEAEALIAAIEAFELRGKPLYTRLQSVRALDVYCKLRTCIKETEDMWGTNEN